MVKVFLFVVKKWFEVSYGWFFFEGLMNFWGVFNSAAEFFSGSNRVFGSRESYQFQQDESNTWWCGMVWIRFATRFFVVFHLCQGLNSHYFHIIGDGHQPNSRGLYTHYKDSLLKVGGFPSPKKRDFWPWHIWRKQEMDGCDPLGWAEISNEQSEYVRVNDVCFGTGWMNLPLLGPILLDQTMENIWCHFLSEFPEEKK